MQAVEPQLAELLRTTIHPPSLLLRVAHVEFAKAECYNADSFTSNSETGQVDPHKKNGYLGKFLLSDGELMIQALLHRKLKGLEDVGGIQRGDVIDIRRFTVNKAARLSGRGKVIFLGIEDCTFHLRSAAEHVQEGENVQQHVDFHLSSKKRPRADESEIPARVEHGTSDQLNKILFAPPSTSKRAKMSEPKHDELILPSSMPSTPPLSLGELESFLMVPEAGKDEKARILSTSVKKTPLHSRKRDSTTRSNKHFDRTFGARTIHSDDDDDGDFFEPIQAIRTPAKVVRAVFKRTTQSPGNNLLSTVEDEKRTPNPISSGLPRIATKPNRAKEVVEPQLPPPPISKRDGTFALSQTPSFYQAQVAPLRRTAPPEQQRPTTVPSKSTASQVGSIKQVALLPSPPFYALQALRQPPPTQSLPKNNVIVTVLAVISWLGTSLLHRAGSPFPPKRHLKVVDPSLTTSRPVSRDTHLQVPTDTNIPRANTTAGVFKPQTTFQDSVTVAVYIDAADFKPVAGTIALFRGLVMQRLANGDIILNAYGRLKDQRFANGISETAQNVTSQAPDNFSHWFITDPEKIRALGYGGKMDYYREWWNRRHSAS